MLTLTDYFDRTLQEEYVTRVMEAWPELDYEEACDRAYNFQESVDVTFGSTGYTVNLQRPHTEDTSSIFLYGYCTIFAHTYGEKHDAQRFLVVSDKRVNDDWSGHVLTESDQADMWFDYNGLNREETLHEAYSPEFYTYEILHKNDFRKRCFKGDYSANPYHNLDEFEIAFTKYIVAMVERSV